MTSTLRASLVAAFAALLLVLSGCSGSPSAAPAPQQTMTDDVNDCAGVVLTVDASQLDERLTQSQCVLADAAITGADLLKRAGIITEGTKQYGDQVVCRVNGIPSADMVMPAPDGTEYTEACDAMPATFAYWAMWVKPAGADWGYAEEGLQTLQLKPGDSFQLLFTLNGEPAAPVDPVAPTASPAA